MNLQLDWCPGLQCAHLLFFMTDDALPVSQLMDELESLDTE